MDTSMVVATLGDKIDSIFYGFDMSIFNAVGSIQNPVTLFFAKFFTAFGDERFMIPLVIVGLFLCFFKRTRKFGATLVGAIAIGTIVTNLVLKPVVLRIRPYNTLQSVAEYWNWYTNAGLLSESDYSLPSGHTTGAFEVAMASALCLRASGRKKLSFIPPVIAVFVGISRIMLMVHYPTDVIAGMIAGILSGLVAYVIAGLLVKLFNKLPFSDKIDLEQTIFKKEISNKVAGLAICGAVFVCFLVAYIPSFTEGGDSVERCSYTNEIFSCYNEARVGEEKYPAIDGQYYCKIHWKQLSGEQ